MFKTIKSKTVGMQVVLMLTIVGIVYVMFMAFFDDYYFYSKSRTIGNVYNYLEKSDLSSILYTDEKLIGYRDRNIKILVSDENFANLFDINRAKEMGDTSFTVPVDSNDNPATSTQSKIDRYIKKKADKFTNEITLENKKSRICGYGYIEQQDNRYYVYIYETKKKMKISFSYTKIFLILTGGMALGVGIGVSIIMANKISKPLKKIENLARIAPENKFEVYVDEEQNFSELSSLARSINIMLNQIRGQMYDLEEEIEHKMIVEEKRRQFVNNVSHEMKTPLAIISNQAEMLALITDDKKREEYCQSIVEETTNMSEMINEMIAIYAAQNENENIKFQYTDLGNLVESMCGKYDYLLEKNHLHMNTSFEDGCFANVNQRYISQAVDNYITNSIKHSPTNGKISVRVYEGDDCITIEVENEGPSIPEENKEKVWNMFFKDDDKGIADGQKSSGLGLYLVKSIVELHGGSYGYTNLKKGIVFWMKLPKCK